MSTPLLEAFETIAQSQTLARRLEAAAAELAKRPGLAEEKAWIATARVRVERAREGIGDILDRALRLEELESMRGELTRRLQGECVDALERLQGGISFAVSPRSPLIEILFGEMKMPLLRRLDREDFERAFADYEKRLGSSYAKRMLADENYAPVVPAVQKVREAFETWRTSFDPPPLEANEAQALCEELVTTAHRIDLPTRQARLLAQAALLSMKELLDAYGLTPKPRRRGVPDPDTHEVLEHDPPDPSEPTEEERAELEAAGAAPKKARGGKTKGE